MSANSVRAKAANIFLIAAMYIDNYGWQVEGMGADGKPRCSMGALASAYPKTKWEGDLAAVMFEALYKELDGISLTDYNHKVSNGHEVAVLFERTASTLAK